MGNSIIPDEERVENNNNYISENKTSGITVKNNSRRLTYSQIVKGKMNAVVKGTQLQRMRNMTQCASFCEFGEILMIHWRI